MMTGAMQRRLAAVLAVDVVGYSKLMGQDEAGTHERLKAHRKEFIEPLIAQHEGRLVKLTGDGALVEFPSAVQAVLCAAEIQRGMADRNAGEPTERRIDFRIGINLGDIIFDEGDIYGDGVNIAARLEGLAEPGGICIARNVHNQVKTKVDLGFETMGQHQVKNIAEPVEVWRVLLDGKSIRPRHTIDRPVRTSLAIAASAALLMAGSALWWGSSYWGSELSSGPAESEALPLPDKPSVAVLPFENLSGEPPFERLAGGLTEDIITDLSRFRELFVIARNSTEVYKDQAVDVRQIARQLGVHYVMEGSLQADEERVRITAQLIDGASSNHVWSERYDRPLDDVFAVQEEVTQAIAGRLTGYEGAIASASRDVAKRKPPRSLQGYDYYLLGVEYKHKFTEDNHKKAEEYLQKATELDPGLTRAYVALAWAFSHDYDNGWNRPREESFTKWLETAQAALETDPFEPEAHMTLGFYYPYTGDVDRSLAEVEKAISLAPNNAELLAISAGVLPWLGRPKVALDNIQRAMRLNPHFPDWWHGNARDALFYSGHFEQALAAAKKAEPTIWNTMTLPLIYAKLNKQMEAEAAAMALVEQEPDYSAEWWLSVMGPYAGQAELDLFLDSNRRAKLPICAADAQLAKYPDMTHLPECDARRVRS